MKNVQHSSYLPEVVGGNLTALFVVEEVFFIDVGQKFARFRRDFYRLIKFSLVKKIIG